MKSPKDMKIIQIEVTNACIHQCTNCTRFCGHHKKPFFMDYDTFTKAVDSMQGFQGVVGIMGGEPTLHPQFERFVQYFREHFGTPGCPKAMRRPTRDFVGHIVKEMFDREHNNQRGLWTSVGKKYYEHFEAIQDTFGYQLINDHLSPSMHQTLAVSRRELGVPDEDWFPLRDACWVQNRWSASITPKGAFFCEVAAAMDMLFGGPGGWPIEPGWWKRKPEDFGDQLHWCELCSAPLAMPKRDARQHVDEVSPVWYQKLQEIGSPKLQKGLTRVFDLGAYRASDYAIIDEDQPYMHDQRLRMGESNKALYPQRIQAVLLLPDTIEAKAAQEIVDQTRLHLDLAAVVSSNPAYAALAGDAVAFYDTSTISGRQVFDGIRQLAKDWVVLLRGVAASSTLAKRLYSAVHNPGCIHLGPTAGTTDAGDVPAVTFFNMRAGALRDGADLLRLVFSYPQDKIVRLEADPNATAKIYLTYHGDTVRIENDILKPIHAGKILSQSDLGIPGDDTGDNVSAKYPILGGLTTQYWAWKNDRQSDYVGCMHDRRLFIFNGIRQRDAACKEDHVIVPSVHARTDVKCGWSEADILEGIGDCDVLLPAACDVTALASSNCGKHLERDFGKEKYQTFLKLMAVHCPEYELDTEDFLDDDRMYLGNMFVMRRELFNRYCEWLFDVLEKILPQLASEADGSPADMASFLAERLLNVFVARMRRENRKLKLKELPWAVIENPSPTCRALAAVKGEKSVVTVATAFDAHYAPCFATLLASIIDHASGDRFYDIVILEDGVPTSDKRLYAQMLQGRTNAAIRYVNMTGVFADDDVVDRHVTHAAFNRLMLPELLPEHAKVVYLDPDTVVLRDVAELFDTNISGYYAAAALDYHCKSRLDTTDRLPAKFGGTTLLGYLEDYLEIGREVIDRYFHSGVMVFNLERIREDNLGEVIDRLFHAKAYQAHDQDILNKAFDGKVLHLDPRWNVIAQPAHETRTLPYRHQREYQTACNDPFVVHFALEDQKPWNDPQVDFGEQFWMYCRKTPYYERVLAGAVSAIKADSCECISKEPVPCANAAGAVPRQDWVRRMITLKSALSTGLRRKSPALWSVSRNLYVNMVRPVVRRVVR